MDRKKVILVGCFHEIIELCEECGIQIIGIIDNRLKKKYLGYNILGTDKAAIDLFKKYKNAPVIITPDYPNVRETLIKYYLGIGFNIARLIHPTATISKYAKIGKGVIIQKGVNVSAGSKISDYVKLNTYVNIMHDIKVGCFTTIAPNAVILGRVKIGSSCYIGANSTILPEVEIKDMVVVGAGAVVTKNVKKGIIVAGNPAKRLN